MDIYDVYRMSKQYASEEEAAIEQRIEEDIEQVKYEKYNKMKSISNLKAGNKMCRIIANICDDDVPFI